MDEFFEACDALKEAGNYACWYGQRRFRLVDKSLDERIDRNERRSGKQLDEYHVSTGLQYA